MTGIVDVDYVRCFICGFSSKKLGNHLLKEHNLSASEYQNQHPGASVLCSTTASALSKAHHRRVNWVAQMKQEGREEELKAKVTQIAATVSTTVMADTKERERRSEMLGTLNKTEKFRKKASETAIKTSSRIDILLARSERLRRWREENPQVFYEKCTSKMVKLQSSKGEKELLSILRNMFPNIPLKGSQVIFRSEFTSLSKRRQLDISDKSNHVIVEFDGPIHFKNIPSWNQLEAVQARDREVNAVLSKEFLLIRVSYDQWHSKRGFAELCLNQIKQEINQHLIVPTPRLVYIGLAYHQDAEHKTASELTMRILTNG